MIADPGSHETLIGFVNREIGPPGSPPVDINITIDGKGKRPLHLTQGLVRRARKFLRGDVDDNGAVNIADALLVLQTVFGTMEPDCEDVLDANDDGRLNIVHVLPVLRFLFGRGEPLPSPLLDCGPDPTQDELGCERESPRC